MTVLAGSGSAGFVNGVGASAAFREPGAITIDNEGNLYVADVGNDVVRKITNQGIVSTYCGSGVSGEADGSWSNASFKNIQSMTIDDLGQIYLKDQTRYRKIHANRSVSTFGANVYLGSFLAAGPNGVYGNDGEFIYKLDGNSVGTIMDLRTRGYSIYNRYRPALIAINAEGHFFAANRNTIYKVLASGYTGTYAGSGDDEINDGAHQASLKLPTDIVFDSKGTGYMNDDGYIRVLNAEMSHIEHFAGDDTYEYLEGDRYTAKFERLVGLAINDRDELYLADKSVIRKIDSNGQVITVAGRIDSTVSVDGLGLDATFGNIHDIEFGPDGNLYILETGLIRVMDSMDYVSTLALDIESHQGSVPKLNGIKMTINSRGQMFIYGSGRPQIIEPNGDGRTVKVSLPWWNSWMQPYFAVYDSLDRLFFVERNQIFLVPDGDTVGIPIIGKYESTSTNQDGFGLDAKINQMQELNVNSLGELVFLAEKVPLKWFFERLS